MSRTDACSIAIAVIAIVVCSRVPAQDVMAGMRACAAEKDDALRLKCYDDEMRRDVAAPAPAAPAARPVPVSAKPPEVEAPELTPEQAFGYRGTIARDEVDRRNEKRDTLDRLEAAVSKVERKPLGEFVLTLENGQVWAQKEPDPRIRLKSGDSVTIRRASLGSFMMTVPNGRSTQVARVK